MEYVIRFAISLFDLAVFMYYFHSNKKMKPVSKVWIWELKTHKITHEDIGQLQMYVNYYDRNEKGSVVNFNWGSNMTVANAGVILGLAYQLTDDTSYLNVSASNLHYLDRKSVV